MHIYIYIYFLLCYFGGEGRIHSIQMRKRSCKQNTTTHTLQATTMHASASRLRVDDALYLRLEFHRPPKAQPQVMDQEYDDTRWSHSSAVAQWSVAPLHQQHPQHRAP